MAYYDTVTKPALRHIGALVRASADIVQLMGAVEDAAAKGATPRELADALGGVDAWNAFVRSVRARGLHHVPKGVRRG